MIDRLRREAGFERSAKLIPGSFHTATSGGTTVKSAVIKRSIIVARHRTSVSLEDVFWVGLREIAKNRGVTLSDLVGEIDMNRDNNNLSSALRLFVFDYVRCHGGGIFPPADAAVRIAAWQTEAEC